MAYNYAYDNEEKNYKPAKLKTDRSMWKLMIFTLLTCGLYQIFFFMPFSYDLDKVAPKRDRSKTMNFVFVYILSLFTFSFVLYIWLYHISDRVSEALERRHIDYEFGTGTFWRWYVLGSFIFVGPFVYFHRLCKAMNLLCEDYNERPVIEEE